LKFGFAVCVVIFLSIYFFFLQLHWLFFSNAVLDLVEEIKNIQSLVDKATFQSLSPFFIQAQKYYSEVIENVKSYGVTRFIVFYFSMLCTFSSFCFSSFP
jgi:hypothetical protein